MDDAPGWLCFDGYDCRHCGTTNIFPSNWGVWARKPRWKCLRCGKPLPGQFHSCSRYGECCDLCGARVYIGASDPASILPAVEPADDRGRRTGPKG